LLLRDKPARPHTPSHTPPSSPFLTSRLTARLRDEARATEVVLPREDRERSEASYRIAYAAEALRACQALPT
jgi:hypothetical protein